MKELHTCIYSIILTFKILSIINVQALMIVITCIMNVQNQIVQVTVMVDGTFVSAHTCTCNYKNKLFSCGLHCSKLLLTLKSPYIVEMDAVISYQNHKMCFCILPYYQIKD